MEAPPNPNSFSATLSTISAAQICRSAGYNSGHPSALRALSLVAIHYIQSIGRLSASFATCQNRTESNLFDLILSLETLQADRGFNGGSDPVRPVLRSSVLKELMAFVRVVDEIPFAKCVIKKEKLRSNCDFYPSFAELGRETPPHVPNWLPCFPDLDEEKEIEKKEMDCVDLGKNWIEKKKRETDFDFRLDLGEEREKIQFSVGFSKNKKNKRITNLMIDF